MSRALIGGVVAGAIAVVTIAAYAATNARLQSDAERDLRRQVAKAQELLIQNASLESLQLLNRVEAVAAEEDYVRALTSDSRSEAADIAKLAFRRFRHGLSDDDPRPDILALTDDAGRVVALLDVSRPLSDMWLDEGEVKHAPLRVALERGLITSELIELDSQGLMRAGVAPVRDEPGGEILGAVVVAYSMSSSDAEAQRDLLDADVAYFSGERVRTASFQDDGRAVPSREELSETLAREGLAEDAFERGLADVVSLELAGDTYLATAGRWPRFSSEALPEDYPGHHAGAMVMQSVSKATASAGALSRAILLVGLGGAAAALAGIALTARSFRLPIEELELGVTDIINGNTERSFRPVGSDLDGLASSLNVMLARLLGRPEPGEETFDEEGNVIGGGTGELKVEAGELTDKDAEAMALAAEPEPDYYRRLFHEYIEARRGVGESVDDVSYESFVAKLRLSEANLRQRYEARLVRFSVVVKDEKVILKPVPIL